MKHFLQGILFYSFYIDLYNMLTIMNFYYTIYSRVLQYVFVPTKEDTFTLLDQHADTLEGDVKPPLVIVGSEGSGKSALLANWVAKRREHKHRDEFLFNHFVGCSSQSLQVITYTTMHISISIYLFYPIL